jgi:hypothetical protein
MVGGHGGIERDVPSEQCGDRVGVGEVARCGYGAWVIDGTGSVGAHGIRGDGVTRVSST